MQSGGDGDTDYGPVMEFVAGSIRIDRCSSKRGEPMSPALALYNHV